MTNLTKMTVHEFVNTLGSDAPAPGGGSASALAGAMGVGLASMVAKLTVGKAKYSEHEPLMQELSKEADLLVAKLLESIDKDTQAFDGVSAVFAMPKNTDEEKEARKNAMQAALKQATIVPAQVMVDSLEALKLAQKAVGKFNVNAASDLGVGAIQLRTAVQGAWLNVLINLGGIKDETFVETYRTQGQKTVQQAEEIAADIYKTILDSLQQ